MTVLEVEREQLLVACCRVLGGASFDEVKVVLLGLGNPEALLLGRCLSVEILSTMYLSAASCVYTLGVVSQSCRFAESHASDVVEKSERLVVNLLFRVIGANIGPYAQEDESIFWRGGDLGDCIAVYYPLALPKLFELSGLSDIVGGDARKIAQEVCLAMMRREWVLAVRLMSVLALLPTLHYRQNFLTSALIYVDKRRDESSLLAYNLAVLRKIISLKDEGVL